MKRCPITYEPIPEHDVYSSKGLKKLSPKLTQLAPLELTAKKLRQEALARADKMSLQGVQKKLSARLEIKAGHFKIVSTHGNYILKPPHEDYPELPV